MGLMLEICTTFYEYGAWSFPGTGINLLLTSRLVVYIFFERKKL